MKTLLLSALVNLSVVTLAFAETCETEGAGNAMTAEIVEFRLAAGTTEEQFLASARSTMGYLCEADGFVRRSLSQDETGLWTDYVEWTSIESAQMAAEAAMQREDMMPFMMAIDAETISFRYANIVPTE